MKFKFNKNKKNLAAIKSNQSHVLFSLGYIPYVDVDQIDSGKLYTRIGSYQLIIWSDFDLILIFMLNLEVNKGNLI